MSWRPPATDPTHDMYQRGKRKTGPSEYERQQIAEALATPTLARKDREIVPDQHGSREQKEAWMRQRQRQRTAEVNGEREAILLIEADAELHQRRILRCERELELRKQLLAEILKVIAAQKMRIN
jgi:hypothetical protein